MRVLLAEDDKRLGKLIQYMLEQNEIQVEWVTNGGDIYEYAMYTDYDILVLDWMMPGETGVDACSRLRRDGYEKAILMLTARDSVEDRVKGLDAGADDYLVKPFEFAELLARLRALGRRSTQKIQQDVIEVGEFRLNRTAKVLKKKIRSSSCHHVSSRSLICWPRISASSCRETLFWIVSGGWSRMSALIISTRI